MIGGKRLPEFFQPVRVLLFALLVQQAAVITVKLRFQGGDIAFR